MIPVSSRFIEIGIFRKSQNIKSRYPASKQVPLDRALLPEQNTWIPIFLKMILKSYGSKTLFWWFLMYNYCYSARVGLQMIAFDRARWDESGDMQHLNIHQLNQKLERYWWNMLKKAFWKTIFEVQNWSVISGQSFIQSIYLSIYNINSFTVVDFSLFRTGSCFLFTSASAITAIGACANQFTIIQTIISFIYNSCINLQSLNNHLKIADWSKKKNSDIWEEMVTAVGWHQEQTWRVQ